MELDQRVLCYMALCTTIEFVPERMESGECVRDLGRHHNETNRLPSQYDSAASMALNQRLPLRLARVAEAGYARSPHSLDGARESFDIASIASRLTSSTMSWADMTSFTKPTPEPAYAVNLPFFPQPLSPFCKASL